VRVGGLLSGSKWVTGAGKAREPRHGRGHEDAWIKACVGALQRHTTREACLLRPSTLWLVTRRLRFAVFQLRLSIGVDDLNGHHSRLAQRQDWIGLILI
jgi:hypothetical protein